MRELPQQRMLSLFKVIRMLNSGEQHISTIARRLKKSHQTAYRYVKILEEMDIVRRSPNKAKNWGRVICPCCGKEVDH